ncbi:peptidoglycan-binding protein [Christensenellaceae bacterium OttesenSCG-928-K19]|nr:peptidoglycan-binding protein [Christensenellaceae bacterium OttesenSCG-928-K19]
MKKILSGIGRGFMQVGQTIKDKFTSGISFLAFKITRKTKADGHPYIRNSYGQRNGRPVAGRPITEKTPVMGASGATPVRAASVSRRQASMSGHRSGRSGHSFFSLFAKLANKKRFATVMCMAVAAVLVPVIAVAAVGSADVPDVEIEETPPPQAVVNFVDAVQPEEEVPVKNAVVLAEPEPEVVEEAEPEPQYLELTPETVNDDVVKLQARLMELHYMDNDEPTEYYGPMTQQAVSYFQRKHNLAVDGSAGPQTQELLFSDEAQTYSVAIGAEGADVGNIQYRLQELGYEVAVTGYFGEDTENKVKYFQRMNGLDDDGSVGQYTKDLLFSEDAQPSEEYTKAQQKSSGSSSGGSGGGGKSSSGGSSSGGGGGGTSTSHVADPGNVEAMIEVALSRQGCTYKTGGKGPDSFDCSGLVYYALKESGNSIGYMTSGGWASSGYATVYSIGELQRGDIICFKGHVGIYLGGGSMVDASSSNGCVVVRDCTGSWSQKNFICGKRPL